MTTTTASAIPSSDGSASTQARNRSQYHRPDSGAPMPAGRYVDTRTNPTVRSNIATRRTTADWIGFGGMMAFTAIIMFVNLTASGYANEFYSAAAQAGSKDWWAFLWGSLDSGNAITVDKPPAAIWLMALSVRVLGLNSFAILLPEALCGMASVWILYATIRRTWGNWAGVIAGLTLATTPVAALMFRFNNPDALLVLLMTGATASVMRALEYPDTRAGNRSRTLWMILAGACIGFGFLTKQMQVFLVVPGFTLAFLVASPTGLVRRIVDGLAAIASVVVSAGWWVALTVLVPSGSRPYIGGSQTDSFLELTFGYNGLGRITGDETGAVVGGGGGMGGGNGGGMWGQTGLTRLFDGEYGGQIAWLAPIAFAGIAIGLIVARRSRRTDLRRAGTLVWGSWLIVTWLTFSFMAGIFHQYYTVALAPAVAALVAIAVSGLWAKRQWFWARVVAALLVLVNTFWAVELLGRSTWLPWLRYLVMAAGLIATLLLIIVSAAAAPTREMRFLRTPHARRVITIAGAGACALTAVALAAGPLAWTAYTVSTGHMGSIVTAGPNVANSTGMGGPGGGQGGPGGQAGPGGGFGGQGAPGGMGMPGQSTDGQSAGSDGQQPDGQQPDGQPSTNGYDGQRGSGGGMGGGLLGGGTASEEVVAMLKENADQYRWAAATTGSQNAASYQLASEQAVMAIGGFNGSDPAPSLEQFKSYVEQGLIHYYISGGGMGGRQLGGSDAASEIASWVSEHYEAQTVDGVTIYDLTSSAS
ncbi:glycosyltransferase family 39 protein [Bifidobacterium sp. UTCIF-37]|uniref:ArnT family glycosyltransferase n=2 Tax=unclassified Bifidobacterium TaxID=2608897 RepID=UPI00215997AD|nr:glycosyltransferase family 39 protein [Bifidobacterium sp. UTCIF-37]